MRNFSVEQLETPHVSEQPIEIVERKGIGHPDTICDGIAEEVSLALSCEYLGLDFAVWAFEKDFTMTGVDAAKSRRNLAS